jgi:hypothetical protein
VEDKVLSIVFLLDVEHGVGRHDWLSFGETFCFVAAGNT